MKQAMGPLAVRWVWCLFAAVLGLGAGWAWHAMRSRQFPDHAAVAGVVPVSSGKVSAAPSGGGAAPTGPAAAEEDALAQALTSAPRIERWLLLVAAAEKAAPDDMPRLLRLCGGDRAALRMVAARWAELNPRHMWQSLFAQESATGAADRSFKSALGMSNYELAEVLVESWIAHDPAAVRAALSENSEALFMKNLRMDTLRSLLKSDPETAVPLITEWKMRHFYHDFDVLSNWAMTQPARAASVVKQLGSDSAGLRALAVVGAAWAKSDPHAALAFVSNLSSSQGAAFAGGVIKQWAGKDTTAVASFVGSLSDSARRAQLAIPLVEAWAKTDPEKALTWTQDTLRGEARATALGGIVGSLAAQDVGRAAELVAGLDAGGSKNKAIVSLVEPWLAKAGGATVADWLLKLPEADAREAGFERLGFQWLWNKGGGSEAAALATGPQRDLVPLNFTMIVAGNEARRDPEAAMKWAGDLPAAHIPVARERILGEWLQSRPDAAAQWVLAQPAGEVRRELISATTRSLAWNATEGTARQFFAELPASERPVAGEILRTTQIPEEKRAELLRALASP